MCLLAYVIFSTLMCQYDALLVNKIAPFKCHYFKLRAKWYARSYVSGCSKQKICILNFLSIIFVFSVADLIKYSLFRKSCILLREVKMCCSVAFVAAHLPQVLKRSILSISGFKDLSLPG
jgi:hypothetical protein